MTGLRLRLPPPGSLTPIDEVDPLRFYYKPLVGRLFQARINAGLGLLDGRFRRLLEIGYGSGLLMPTLATISDELYGADLQPEAPGLRKVLEGMGTQVRDLVRADIQSLPFASEHFDGVVAFSILEHLKEAELIQAVGEVARVLEPGGRFLVGCPAVHKAMNLAFAAIGFSNIEDHHFSGIDDVLRLCAAEFTVVRERSMPAVAGRVAPLHWAPYATVLFRKR